MPETIAVISREVVNIRDYPRCSEALTAQKAWHGTSHLPSVLAGSHLSPSTWDLLIKRPLPYRQDVFYHYSINETPETLRGRRVPQRFLGMLPLIAHYRIWRICFPSEASAPRKVRDAAGTHQEATEQFHSQRLKGMSSQVLLDHRTGWDVQWKLSGTPG